MASAAEAVIPISSAQKPERSIHQRMNAVMREVKGVEKGSTNQHGRYNYASHEAVTEAIRASFVKHGIVQTASMVECDVLEGGAIKTKVRVVWACDDNPASCVVSEMFAIQHCQTKAGNVTAQQVGQALSYAVKNVAFKQLMLIGDPEPDSDSAEANDRRSEPPARPLSQPPPRRMSADAIEFLARFGMCETNAQIAELSNEAKKLWGSLKKESGFAEEFTKARREAYDRVKRASREPGEEG